MHQLSWRLTCVLNTAGVPSQVELWTEGANKPTMELQFSAIGIALKLLARLMYILVDTFWKNRSIIWKVNLLGLHHHSLTYLVLLQGVVAAEGDKLGGLDVLHRQPWRIDLSFRDWTNYKFNAAGLDYLYA